MVSQWSVSPVHSGLNDDHRLVLIQELGMELELELDAVRMDCMMIYRIVSLTI